MSHDCMYVGVWKYFKATFGRQGLVSRFYYTIEKDFSIVQYIFLPKKYDTIPCDSVYCALFVKFMHLLLVKR